VSISKTSVTPTKNPNWDGEKGKLDIVELAGATPVANAAPVVGRRTI
jgi:hypothetical protein